MKKDLYPIFKYAFENFLIENNYSLKDNNIWKKFIHPDYCIHIVKKRKKKNNNDEIYEICRRKKIPGKEYCGRHSPKNEHFINRCNFNNCKKITKLNQLCHIHKKQFNNICNIPLPFPNNEELAFYGHNIYNCNIYNIITYINIKEIILDGKYGNLENHKNFEIVKYFDLKKYINNIITNFYSYINYYINKYNININFLCTLFNLLLKINKNDKNVSISLKNKKKKKKNKKKKNISNSTNPLNFTNKEKYEKYIHNEHQLCGDILSLELKDSYFYDHYYKKTYKKEYIKELFKYKNDKINYIKYLYENNLLSDENVYNKPFFLHIYSLIQIYFDVGNSEDLNETKCKLIDIFRKYYTMDDAYDNFNDYCVNKYKLFVTEFNPYIVYKYLDNGERDICIKQDIDGTIVKRY